MEASRDNSRAFSSPKRKPNQVKVGGEEMEKNEKKENRI